MMQYIDQVMGNLVLMGRVLLQQKAMQRCNNDYDE
jgi:hypothetical protein